MSESCPGKKVSLHYIRSQFFWVLSLRDSGDEKPNLNHDNDDDEEPDEVVSAKGIEYKKRFPP